MLLGDSFIEGVWLPVQQRLSDLLEQNLGIEMMNFGVSNAGTTQYLLIYKYLASSFSHSLVLCGILPANDFRENDYREGLVSETYRYRPYLVGRYPDYEITYYNKEFFWHDGMRWPWNVQLRGFLANFSMSYRTASYIKQILHNDREQTKCGRSWYYDYNRRDWNIMRWTIEKLHCLAAQKDAQLLVFTIPVWIDILRYRRIGSSPLSKDFEELANDVGFTYVDLLPGFVSEVSRLGSNAEEHLFIRNDGHWSAEGNKLAFEILAPYVERLLDHACQPHY
jgi:lysophospholipase L1-like esterase